MQKVEGSSPFIRFAPPRISLEIWHIE